LLPDEFTYYVDNNIVSAEPEIFDQTLKELFTLLQEESDNQSNNIKALLELTDQQGILIAKLEARLDERFGGKT